MLSLSAVPVQSPLIPRLCLVSSRSRPPQKNEILEHILNFTNMMKEIILH